MPSLRPSIQSNGSISSQDGGAQELPGTYTTRPIQAQVGKVGSFTSNPALGTRAGAGALGKLNNRKSK